MSPTGMKVPSVLLFLAGALSALSAPVQTQTPEQLKTLMARETDPIDRAKIQIRLATLELDGARKQFDEGLPEKGIAGLKEMMALVEKAEDELFSTGHNPRRKPRGFKEAEIKLRELSRKLEDVRMSLPTDERAEVEKVQVSLQEIRDRLLHGLMFRDKKKQ